MPHWQKENKKLRRKNPPSPPTPTPGFESSSSSHPHHRASPRPSASGQPCTSSKHSHRSFHTTAHPHSHPHSTTTTTTTSRPNLNLNLNPTSGVEPVGTKNAPASAIALQCHLAEVTPTHPPEALRKRFDDLVDAFERLKADLDPKIAALERVRLSFIIYRYIPCCRNIVMIQVLTITSPNRHSHPCADVQYTAKRCLEG